MRTFNLTLLVLLLIQVISGSAQVGKQFPVIAVENMDGDELKIPTYFDKDFTFIGVANSKKAEDDLRSWQVPVYNKFIAKTGLMDGMYDVAVCFLPIFTGASAAAKGQVVKKLKENNEPLVLDNVLIYAGGKAPFEEIKAFDRDEPVFMLLNSKGKILWQEKGAFRQQYLDDVENIVAGEMK